jgi:DNA polymerase-3 subunit gamma/tau
MPGAGPADVLRKNWDAVLESVKRERRVAAILLSDTSVVSVEGGILTLRFAKEGDLKRFSTSDYDADLKRVLSAGFGLNVMVKGVVGEGDAASTAPGRQPASPPAFAASRAAPLDDGPPDDEPPDEMMPDDLSPDEFLAGDAASGPAELTGMDLIQRELGGQVISEIED